MTTSAKKKPRVTRAKKSTEDRGKAIVEALPTLPEERREQDVLEFIRAIEAFKKKSGRPFTSWSDILDIVRSLGYRRR